MLLEGESSNNLTIKNLDEFNSGGNCKVQEGVLIYMEKTVWVNSIKEGIVNYNSLN